MNPRILVIVLVVLAAGCLQPQTEIKEISIDGHGNQIYQFSYDVRESVRVPTNGEEPIRRLIADSGRLSIIFNSTSLQDNAIFQVAAFNIASKLPTYFSYEGKLLPIDVFYYTEDGLYNKTKEPAALPANAKILLVGPSAATETSVKLQDTTITVQGTDARSLILAADKLALVAMNITVEKIRAVSQTGR